MARPRKTPADLAATVPPDGAIGWRARGYPGPVELTDLEPLPFELADAEALVELGRSAGVDRVVIRWEILDGSTQRGPSMTVSPPPPPTRPAMDDTTTTIQRHAPDATATAVAIGEAGVALRLHESSQAARLLERSFSLLESALGEQRRTIAELSAALRMEAEERHHAELLAAVQAATEAPPWVDALREITQGVQVALSARQGGGDAPPPDADAAAVLAWAAARWPAVRALVDDQAGRQV